MTDHVVRHDIDVARDFSATPLGRTRKQGRFSGEAFREDILRPALAAFRVVTVDLDHASGLSTGFLDEAFAGLVRDKTLTPAEFRERVRLISDRDPYLLEEVLLYVDRAALQFADA